MSNSLAIGAVTATLRSMLDGVNTPLPIDPQSDPDLVDAHCTARPPDKARTSEDTNQLNLFLYQTVPNAAMRNLEMPGQVRPGETGMSPLAINLYYLLTAYGKNFDDVLSHRLLGRAMSILHDRAILLPADLVKAPIGNDLDRQIERVRVTPHSISTEEISKLWAVFQTPYRVSAAYEVSVVLIDSSRPTRTPLPVLLRGPLGKGNDARPSAVPAYPTLVDVGYVLPLQPSAQLGENIAFSGHDLVGVGASPSTVAAFTHAALPASNVVGVPPILNLSAGGFVFPLPNAPMAWPAGMYTVAVTVTADGKARTSNSLPLSIAPQIVARTPASGAAAATTTLTLTVTPAVWSTQRATLLVGDTEFLAHPHPGAPTTTLQFDVFGLDPAVYPLRLRVDGVDSFIINYAADPPAFDTSGPRTVTLT